MRVTTPPPEPQKVPNGEGGTTAEVVEINGVLIPGTTGAEAETDATTDAAVGTEAAEIGTAVAEATGAGAESIMAHARDTNADPGGLPWTSGRRESCGSRARSSRPGD